MVTVVDPLGTPSIVYNKSGKTLMYLTANAGGDFVDAVEISHITEDTTVVLNLADSMGNAATGAVYFASDFDLGDRVTLISNHGTLNVYDSAGTFIDGPAQNSQSTYMRINPSTYVLDWRRCF